MTYYINTFNDTDEYFFGIWSVKPSAVPKTQVWPEYEWVM